MSALSNNVDPSSAASAVATPNSAPASAPQKKRRRPPVACEQCRSRKIRCDKLAPCNHCINSGNPEKCTYAPTHGPKTKQLPLGQVPDPNLSRYVARRSGLALNAASGPGMSHEPSPSALSHSTSGPAAPLVPTAVFEQRNEDQRRQAEGSVIQEQGDYWPVLDESVAASADCDGTGNDGESVTIAFEDISLKDKFIGQSHWKNGFLDLLPEDFYRLVTPRSSKGNHCALFRQCKSLGRHIDQSRLQSVSSSTLGSSLHSISHATADRLLHLYMSTFEPVFPILHLPSFRAACDAYWKNPNAATDVFRMQYQLVIALGASLLDDEFSLRSQVMQWIYEVEVWLLHPSQRGRATLASIQTMALVTLSRMVSPAERETIWVLAGTLLRAAMSIGLHRDPSKLEKRLTTFRAEMRRRLWLTVMELNLQGGYDTGAAPLISCQDYDTLLPADRDDEELDQQQDGRSDDGMEHIPSVSSNDDHNKNKEPLKRLSIALALGESLPLRLVLLKQASKFRGEVTYSETLRLNTDLVQACRSLSAKLCVAGQTPVRTAAPNFLPAVRLAELLVYRSFHTLHQPHVLRSLHDPKYYFSHKMYVDGAFRVAQISGFMNTQETEDVNEAVNERIFCRLLTNSGGTFSNAPLQATLGIILELVSKSCHNEVLGLGYRTGIPDLRDKDVGNLISILESACQWTLRRIRAGNTHFKPYYFLACYLKYVSAVQQGARGALFEERVLAGAADCAEACLAELKAIAEKQGLATKAAEHQQPRESHPLSATSFPLDTDLSIPEMEVDLDLVGFMSTWPFIDTSGISNTAGSDDRENMWL